MDSLMSKPTRGDIKLALRNLPKGTEGLDITYKQAMDRIDGQEEDVRELAKQVLSWLIHAKRLLTATELQYALAVRVGMQELDKDFIPDVEVILSICAGLVTVGKNNIIGLVHYTTQEYFERTWETWFPDAHTDITKTCATYLSFKAFEAGLSSTMQDFKERLQSNALYSYAARNWGYHAHISSIEGGKLILDLLSNTAKVSACSQVMIYDKYGYNGETLMTGMHLAAYFGLWKSMSTLLETPHDVNPEDKNGRTPLSWAAENGHEAVAKLLLDRNANVKSKDNSSRTPLSWAAENGHEAVVKLLLDRMAMRGW
jgi:hypothetical protein